MCNGVWWLLRSVCISIWVSAFEIGGWVSVFGVWWVSTIEIEDFWWVLGKWVTRFQGSFGGDGGGGGGGSVC